MRFNRSPVPAWLASAISNRHLAAVGLGFILVAFIIPIVLLVPESLAFDSQNIFESYETVLTGYYIDAYIRSLIYGFLTTVGTIILAFILAYYLRFVTRYVRVAMALVIVPLWIAYIVRYFGIQLFLAPAGPFTDLTGIRLNLLFTTPAVILGLTNVYIPFAVLPIYNSLASINDEVIDASRTLGAGRARTLLSVIIPLSMPGIVAGGLIVFILAAGSFLGPAVLGGPRQLLIANFIAQAFLENFNIQLASALAVVYTILLLALLLVFNWVVDLQEVLGNI